MPSYGPVVVRIEEEPHKYDPGPRVYTKVVEKVIARLEARLAERGEANPSIASASDVEQRWRQTYGLPLPTAAEAEEQEMERKRKERESAARRSNMRKQRRAMLSAAAAAACNVGGSAQWSTVHALPLVYPRQSAMPPSSLLSSAATPAATVSKIKPCPGTPLGLPPEQFKMSPPMFSAKMDKNRSTKLIFRRKRPRLGSSCPNNDDMRSAHVDEINDTGCSSNGQERRRRLDAGSREHQNEAAEKEVDSSGELVTSRTGGESRDSAKLSTAPEQLPNSAGGDGADACSDTAGGTESAPIVGPEEGKSDDVGEGGGEIFVGSVDHLIEILDHDVNVTANYEGEVIRALGKTKKWQVKVEGGVVEGHGQVYVLGECSCLLTPL